MWSSESFSWHSWSTISWAFGDESGVPEEELRQDYRGNGSGTIAPGLPRDYLLDGKPIVRQQYTDDDIRRLVDAKYEAIEAARIKDAQAFESVKPEVENIANLSTYVEPTSIPDKFNLSIEVSDTQVLPSKEVFDLHDHRRKRNMKAAAIAISMLA